MKKDLYFDGQIAEMSGENHFNIDVKLPSDIDIKKLTEGDNDPVFVTVEALNPQISRNRRRWTEEAMRSVAEQVNTKRPDGYMGHIKEEDADWVTPSSQTIWLGAEIHHVKGKPRLFIKGYVMPYAKTLKNYLRKAQAAGKAVAVSVYGKGRETVNRALKAYDISDFVLESIDWARGGRAGIQTAGILKLTAEMEKKYDTDRNKIVMGLSYDDLSKERPDLIAEIANDIRGDMLEDVKDEVKRQTIAEMGSEVTQLKREKAERLVDELLQKQIKLKSARNLIKSGIIAEMTSFDDDSVTNLVTSYLNKDDTKTVIAEMAKSLPSTPSPTTDNRQHNSGRKYTN